MTTGIDTKPGQFLDVAAMLALFFIIFFATLPFARLELITADASGYLDIGRNLFSGNGAISTYNLYQFWPDISHPCLPYMQSVYPFIAGLIWWLFNIKAVVVFNILLLSLNAILLYKIIRLELSCFISFQIVLLLGLSWNLVFSAIFPWSEHLHLFLFLLSLFIYCKYEASCLLLGMILAVSYLVRVGSLYNISAFFITIAIIKGLKNNVLKDYFCILLGFSIIFLPYQLFCYFKYGLLYPEYLTAAKTFRGAEIFSGAVYKNAFPVLRLSWPIMNIDTIRTNLIGHLYQFIDSFRMMRFVFVFVFFHIFSFQFKNRNRLFIVLFLQGLTVILGYSASLYWLPNIEALRYSLIPYIMFVILGLLSLKEMLPNLFPKASQQRLSTIWGIIILVSLCFEAKSFITLRDYYLYIYPKEIANYETSRDGINEWIKQHTAKDTLIASSFIQDAFLFERPFVALPPGKAMNAKNLLDFLAIYMPKYIISSNAQVVHFLKNNGFSEILRNEPIVLMGG